MKLTAHQLSMLKMFEAGWGFKLYSKRRGSWNTFWSLRRRGLLAAGETIERKGIGPVAINRLTDAGREVLAEIRNREEVQS